VQTQSSHAVLELDDQIGLDGKDIWTRAMTQITLHDAFVGQAARAASRSKRNMIPKASSSFTTRRQPRLEQGRVHAFAREKERFDANDREA